MLVYYPSSKLYLADVDNMTHIFPPVIESATLSFCMNVYDLASLSFGSPCCSSELDDSQNSFVTRGLSAGIVRISWSRMRHGSQRCDELRPLFGILCCSTWQLGRIDKSHWRLAARNASTQKTSAYSVDFVNSWEGVSHTFVSCFAGGISRPKQTDSWVASQTSAGWTTF